MINGLPLPTNDPPQVVLNHDKTVPDPPVALRFMVPASSEQKPDLSEITLTGAWAVEDKIISKALLDEPEIAGPLLITLIR